MSIATAVFEIASTPGGAAILSILSSAVSVIGTTIGHNVYKDWKAGTIKADAERLMSKARDAADTYTAEALKKVQSEATAAEARVVASATEAIHRALMGLKAETKQVETAVAAAVVTESGKVLAAVENQAAAALSEAQAAVAAGSTSAVAAPAASADASAT